MAMALASVLILDVKPMKKKKKKDIDDLYSLPPS